MRDLVLDDVDPGEFKYAYIGYTKDFDIRMKQHLQHANDLEYKVSAKLYNRLRYYGWDNFDKIILMSGLSEEEAKDAEIETIAKYNTFEQGLNSTLGGDGVRGVWGASHPCAQAVNIYNNLTDEITSFTWGGDAAEYLGIERYCVYQVLNPSNTVLQTYSPKFDGWFQIKHAYDDTPFIENMPSRYKKTSGDNHCRARAIKLHNNTTNEIFSFTTVKSAADYLAIDRKRISTVLGNNSVSQTYSPKFDAWFQAKYVDDNTSFVDNMMSRDEKTSGDNCYRARSIKLYNNSTTEITAFTWIGGAADYLAIDRGRISAVLDPNSLSCQTYSPKLKSWFQIKYIDDETPFVQNMLTPRNFYYKFKESM